ncbi:hypothetical protein B0H16DRAFT_1738836 [Mycena metata]|uniref:Uncharacterized protein n=1 Tax=Mycena metata TaxID=1033252 RepID=A0AAD7HGR9_9AGAR|nr:hypothetical protein B0H16DRAFT_1739972 [Mycena metata]KAJ7720415.1 hypothetical protein B0H16DRAFT_1738836 [Mycena metata]
MRRLLPELHPGRTTIPLPRPLRLLKSIVVGTHEITERDYPSFFYEEGSYDVNDLEKGLLRSNALPRILRHVLVGPKSAINGLRDSIPSGCDARPHGVFKISPEMLGYAGVQDWRRPDGQYNYDKLFKNIVNLFSDAEDPWVVETLT